MSCFIWGKPGVGKSDVIKQFTKEAKLLLSDVRLTTLDAPDLRGLQWVNEANGTTVSYRPEFFPNKDSAPGVVFLDELTAAEPRMQATAYQLVLDRRIGPHALPDSWMVIGAGNRPEDGAISYKMGSALADRFCHIVVEANPQDWIIWAQNNEIHPTVLSFIRVKPDYLCSVMGQDQKGNLISPSPRSWAKVSQVMKGVGNKKSQQILINGIVGESAGIEFKHITEEIEELPSMDDLFKHQNMKMLIKHIPMKLACLYGLAYSMVAYVKTAQDICKASDIFDALTKESTKLPIAEIETLGMEMILQKAVKLNVLQEVVQSNSYKRYSPKAAQLVGTISGK